jgi:outer membrane receptor protein involved in Fe transport
MALLYGCGKFLVRKQNCSNHKKKRKKGVILMTHFSKRKVAIAVLGLLFLVFLSVPTFAGITGKISGRVIDAESGAELPGASIRIDGTTMGNMAGPDGSYFIINIPPGVYSVTASLIGYISVTAKDVQVKSDLTTEQNFKLKASAIEVKGVTVLGERKVIEKDITASVRTISTQEIKNMPVKEISEILATQVGFVTRANELHIRGGRSGEALYIVDGVETRDLLGGLGKVSGGMNVSSSNIEEVSVMTGGFDAEYGNVQSAVINLVTKEGSSKTTSGYFEFLTDDFGTSKLNTYSRNSDRVEFSLNGPDPFLTTKFLPSIGIKFLGEKLAYYLSGITNKTDTQYEVNKYATPTTRKSFRVDKVLGFDVPERMSNDYSASFKLTYKASADKKLVFSHKQNWERYSLYFDPSGGEEQKATRGEVNIWQYRYTPSTIPQVETHNNSLSLLFTHNVSKSSFYELQISRFYTSYFQRPGDPNNPGAGKDPDGFTLSEYWEYFYGSQDANFNGKWDDADPYLDVNGNGQYDLGEPFQDVNKGKNGVWDPGEGDAASFDPKVDDLPGEGRWNNAEAFLNDNDDPNDPNDGVGTPDGKFDEWKQDPAWGGGSTWGIDFAETYIDGDINLGEPFTDLNEDGLYEFGEPYQDLNANGKYDGPYDAWTPGVPFVDRNQNGTFDYANGMWDPGEPYVDANDNGKWDDKDGFYDRGNERRSYYHHRQSTMLTLKFDFTSQVSKEHQVRTGVMVERMKLSYADLRYPYIRYTGPADNGPWPDRGSFRDFYIRRPIRGAWYIRDKIEYGAMIANLGFRYDFFLQSADIRAMKPEETPTETTTVDTRSKFSPRIGVSYPITDKAKVYFNYGHFYQLPELQWMYMLKTQTGVAQYGNYNLDYTKVIQYELGVDYAISSNYKLTVKGFYKDYFGLMNTDQLKIGPKTFEYWANIDYGRARGLEMELNKRYGGYISGYINYQYGFAYGKSSTEASNYYNRAVEGGNIPIQEFPLDWDVRHQITLNFDLRVPQAEHPKLFGFKLPDNWGLNVVCQYSSGFPFTPDTKFPGLHVPSGESPLPNSKRAPSNSNVDLRLNKDFKVWKLNYSIVALVTNLFDTKNITYVYGTTGRPDTDQISFDQDFNANVVYQGREIENNPLHWGAGRNIRLGLSLNF